MAPVWSWLQDSESSAPSKTSSGSGMCLMRRSVVMTSKLGVTEATNPTAMAYCCGSWQETTIGSPSLMCTVSSEEEAFALCFVKTALKRFIPTAFSISSQEISFMSLKQRPLAARLSASNFHNSERAATLSASSSVIKFCQREKNSESFGLSSGRWAVLASNLLGAELVSFLPFSWSRWYMTQASNWKHFLHKCSLLIWGGSCSERTSSSARRLREITIDRISSRQAGMRTKSPVEM